ncbi:jg11798 [Pararge aegeria aegeria]|uniref:Jg11798 protein n=2 Tax=Pararge aegeria TaxID=116150 RepID=A0A8S4S5K6_9NEOP|nr:jg11798 [Pararge aegeria aegeria]
MSYLLDRGGPSSASDSPERRALVLPFKVPRSYGSVLPYYRFMREALSDPMSNESLHRSESMVSLACFKTLSQLVNNDGNELQNYLSTNRNINIDDRDEVKVVALLLEKGADVHAHGNYNINSLVWAAGRRHSGVVARLLAAGARPNSCDKYATSALTWAARAGDVASSAALLRAGADANNAGMYCWTPLLQATHGNHFEIVQMLLEHKPNVNALDKDGCTALAIACKEGFYDISLALINSGAYINVQDHSKDTPLIYAVKGGYKNIVEALLKKHVDVDLPGKEKKTPVYTAVEKGHLAILKLLLASNPDLEHCTNSGDTALLRAVRSRNAEVVSLLLERRARVAAADNRGDTSLHVAMRARSKQIVEILLRNPKNSQLLYKPNKNKETPYNIDMSYNKTILGQIFGARKLNTNEDNENMLGYELYSAALADMLSEPSLSVPITVGLYARWGSGKSFLLNKLKEEMKNFARQWRETGWAWSWAVSWGTWHVALFVAACVAVAGVEPYIALAVLFALFAALYMTFYLLWYLGNKYEWWWADGIVAALGRKFGSLLLLLQVMFCHPPGPEDPRALPATPIRFHFTEGMKNGAGQEGEAMVVQMIGSLAEALECQYGRVCTRLARAFRPRPVSSTSGWKWRRACCIPHIITFELSFMCVLVSICVLIIFLTDKDPSRRDVPQGLVVGVCAAAGAVLLANLYAGARAVAALALPPRARLARLARAIRKDRSHALALRPEVQALTHTVSCLDAFTGQQTRLVLVVDALDSCEQEKVLALLNAVHALCSDPKSPFILLLAIDPHIISKAVEMNSRRAFSESNIGGWDYLRNMVQLPFYLQNSALRRVKLAQQTATKRIQALGTDDFSTSLQRSVSARRLSSTSELMSSQERIKGGARPEVREARADRAPRLRPSESVASSVASGLHRVPAPAGGAADLGRVLLTDDYFSDVNPRSMRRLMNVLYVTGRLLKAFQIEFNWYQLASWVNLTEQWPFRTSWIIYHHETYEDHIDDSTSLKHIYEKVKPSIGGLREAITLMELDRDERKLDVFLSFHRATLTAADLKIFLPFTINLDPYIKKVIKEEQVQAGAEDDIGAGAATAVSWGITPNARQTHPKPLHKKQFAQKPPPVPQPAQNNAPGQPMWVGWANPLITTAQTYSNNIPADCPVPQIVPVVAINPVTMLRTAFPGMSELSSLRLSTLSVERVCRLVHTALGMGGVAAAAALQRHRVCGLVLSVCHLNDLKPILELPFGDWELFKMLVLNLRELESGMPINTSAVTVITEKSSETETDTIKPRSTLEHQRTRPSNVEKQVTLEEQMICGALQTLNEEAMEDVLQSEPTAPSGEALRTIREHGLGSPPSLHLTPPTPHTPPSPSLTDTSEEGERPDHDGTASTDFSPRSEITDAGSPRGSAPDFDLLPEGKGEGRAAIRAHFAREASDTSLSNMVEPYNMRLLAHGASDGSRGLWRQDALDSLDSGPPWPPHEPDSAV